MRKRNKNKPNQTGRNPTTRFARLDHRLLNSPAYRALTPTARALLVELTMLDNGENCGFRGHRAHYSDLIARGIPR